MKNFIDLEKLEVKDRLPGATASYFDTQKFTVAFTELKAGAEIPVHQHVHEAVDIVLEGELEMQIGNNVRILKPGMMSVVPSNARHGARAVSDCKVVTISHPKRELYRNALSDAFIRLYGQGIGCHNSGLECILPA